jgi:hypothetical protein
MADRGFRLDTAVTAPTVKPDLSRDGLAMIWCIIYPIKQRSARFRRWIFALLAWLAICGVAPIRQAQAHGGAVIASGFTEAYEWLVAVDPYPTTPGSTVITLLVFDLKTFQPVLDLQDPQLHLTPPGGETGTQGEIVPLETDPTIYPGDYSAVVALDQTGDWRARFVAAGDNPLEVTATLRVFPGPGSSAPAGPASAPNAVATATIFAQNVAAARATQTLAAPGQPSSPLGSAGVSPLVIQVSPLAAGGGSASPASREPSGRANPFGDAWWLWGMLGLVPIAALFAWALRPYQEDEP